MKMKQIKPLYGPARERGAAMVIALVMLLVLTLLATASARMTLMEERMTGNTQDRNIAFQAAEAALRTGEAQAQAPVLPNFENNASGLYVPAAPGDDPVWSVVDWVDNDDVLLYEELDDAPGALSEATAGVVIEQLPPVLIPGPGESLIPPDDIEDGLFFRITARGVGVGGNATVTLQTTFKR